VVIAPALAVLLDRLRAVDPVRRARGGVEREERVRVADRRRSVAADRPHVDRVPGWIARAGGGDPPADSGDACRPAAVGVGRAGDAGIIVTDAVGDRLVAPQLRPGVEVEGVEVT